MRGQHLFVAGMLAPAFVILALFYAYPTFQNLAISFTDLSLLGLKRGSNWVGLDNYQEFLAGAEFRHVLFNTVMWLTALSVALRLVFGLGMSAKVAFGAIHGIIPIALFTINAVRNIRPVLIKTGRVLKYSPAQMAWNILIPAALPEIVTGLRIGFSLTLVGTLLGEMFASQRGLGNLLMRAIGLHNVDLIMAIALVVTVVAAVGSSLLLAIDRRLHARV